ncbi:indole-3-glycerol phosphate synthase TrpC [Rhodohalobacter sp. 8-1]|uniref:indole-3-glycerol phosphate synthase TrpC n=1 Tax=Rhodohalobacter sp. 8-1 TaxID=3131972 RepID=UPI0030EEBE42
MATILDQIVEKTASDLAKRKGKISWKSLESFAGYEKKRQSLYKALKKDEKVSVIAEIKKGSPSEGIIRHDFDPVKLAEMYQEGGAAAISVLSDEPFFMGSLEYLKSVSEISTIPVLRKDFIIDPYQVKEAAAYGADAVLLIATICQGDQLHELLTASKEYGLEALVECYHEDEVDNLNWDTVDILGVNNRDLGTFEVDLHRGVKLLQKSPKDKVRVSESGLSTADDLFYLYKNNINAALIGEHLMRKKHPGNALEQLLDDLSNKIETYTSDE